MSCEEWMAQLRHFVSGGPSSRFVGDASPAEALPETLQAEFSTDPEKHKPVRGPVLAWKAMTGGKA